MKVWHLASAFALLAESVVADLAYCATDNTGSSYKAGAFEVIGSLKKRIVDSWLTDS